MLILLVDDNRTVCAALRLALGRLGHEVRVATSIAAARAAFEAESFDLIISDAQLGDGNGLDLLASIRRHRRIPAVAISADPPAEDGRDAYDVYLSKPIRTEDLREALRRACGEPG